MPAYDNCEPKIINALQKDGWRILEKPLMIRTETYDVFADCLLQHAGNGRMNQIIVVEVKCFTNPKNDLNEFYVAIGQYLFYRSAIEAVELKYPICLAVPHEAYNRLIEEKTI